MRIQNGILLTMEGERFENGYVDFENGKITGFGDCKDAPAYDGEVVDGESKVTYLFAGYINDAIFDGGDEAVNKLKEEHKDSVDWYVSDNYLYMNGTVWIPKK